MASQAILGNAKSLKVAVVALSGAVLLLLGVVAGSQLAGSGKAGDDREVNLSFGGVGVKMKAKELGKALDQAGQAFESGEVNRALLQNPNSPLVKLARAHFPMKMWGAANATLEALEKAGRGADPKFELLREYVKSYQHHRVFKPGPGKDRRVHAAGMYTMAKQIETEMTVLANSGETAGHLRYYYQPQLKGKIGPGLNAEYRKDLIDGLRRGRGERVARRE